MPYPCFLLTPTEYVQHQLRRYSNTSRDCAGPYGYHNAMSGVIARLTIAVPGFDQFEPLPPEVHPSDPRWPVKCDHCGYEFTTSDPKQSWTERLYMRSDTGELETSRGAQVGAMWWATWLHGVLDMCGHDGRSLIVRLPGNRDWNVDSRASNCTLPGDWEHRCWIRHGEPPFVTVDKVGKTCQAGAGSISVPGYHGFLREGVLT